MRAPQFKLKLWMLELLIWALGLFSAVLAGAGNSPVEKSHPGGRPPIVSPEKETEPGFPQVPPRGAARARVQAAYGRLPLGFEINRGQAEPSVDFLSRSNDALFFLKAGEAELRFRRTPLSSNVVPRRGTKSSLEDAAPAPSHPLPGSSSFTSVRLRLAGANPGLKPHGLQELSRKSHYLVGNDPQFWKVNVASYAKVLYSQVYPGIDLIYYGNQQQLEYDFIVTPGASPQRIALQFDGLVHSRRKPPLSVDANGDLLLQTEAGELRQRKPVVFQEQNGGRQFIAGGYEIRDARTVGFEIGTYDPKRTLIIDPVLTYSLTGIGGSAIAVDAQGHAYVTGTANPAFITTPRALQTAPGGGTCVSGPVMIPCPDIVIAKLNPEGTDLVYSTFLGGSGSDYAYGITLDAAGNAYVTGATTSTNFPTTPSAFQTTHDPGTCGSISLTAPCNNAFVAKLNSTGTALIYSTYLNGNSGGLGGNGVAVDSLGQAYVTGDRASGSFVTKLNAAGSAAVYSVAGVGGSAVAVDHMGSAYVTGRRGGDSFVSKLNSDGSAVLYSFRLGGSVPVFPAPSEEVEALTGIAVDQSGSAYVTGYTAYSDFPTTPGVPFPAPPGVGICGSSLCRDAFVSKINSSGTALVYSTFLGGDSIDYGTGIAVDLAGNAYITGVTRSTNFPLLPASPSSAGGVFVAQLNPAGTALVFSTRLGSGQSSESGNGIAVDAFGNTYVTGNAGIGFPVTEGSFQPPGGANSGFVARIFHDLTLFVPIILSSAGQNNSFFTSELTLTNRAARDAALEFTYTAAFGGGSGRVTDSLAAGRQRVVPDAIAYLRSLGMSIPETGNRGGTLAIRFSGLSSSSEGAATVRTTTAVNEGRVGLAYSGILHGFTSPTYLFGLRHNASDRSNVALQNMGTALQGAITLRLTVFSGEPSFPPASVTLADETLAPGEFRQFSGILQTNGAAISSGFVRVERVRGSAPYYAYAVVNDQTSSDGSFITPVPTRGPGGTAGLTLPVVVESAAFNTDLVLANWSGVSKIVRLTFVADAVQTPTSTSEVSVLMRGHEQLILPNIVQWMRQRGAAGLALQNQAYVGPLFVTVPGGDASNLYAGARTVSRGTSGQYGVSYDAVRSGAASSSSAWIYGLQQNDENRTNLGLVNTGETDTNPDTFRLELFDGESGTKVNTIEGITVGARRLLQTGSLFEKFSPATRQGYIRVTRTGGSNPFIAFCVINDGATPGERTGDGAFISSAP